MARLLFEEQSIRIRRGRLAHGVEFVVYTDPAGTVLADISATSGGSSIASSTVTTADIDGLGPAAFRFYGPPSGQDTLYLRCPADTSLGVQEIEADTDERLDALEAGGGAASHPDLATHDTLGLATDAELSAHALDTTSIHGITDTTVLATDAEVTSAVSVHAADTDPHGDRAYADAIAQGLDVKASVLVASTADLTLSGEQTIDGVLTSADRVLVKNQAAGAANGIYVSAAGAWARAADADTAGEVGPGVFVFVESGTVNGGTGWAQTTPNPITLGTTALVFSQFSAAGTIIGGAGLVKTGNTLDVVAGTGIVVAADTVGITPGGVTNTQVNAAAAIAESKLALNFPTHAEDHAARHAAAGADPLAGYVLESAHTSAAHDTLGLVTDAILAAHEADTTVVHGITDTSALATTSGVTAAVSTHAGLTDPHTGYVLESLLDAKGDLLAASAADTPAKLTVGADGSGLTPDSTATAGVKWLTAPVFNVKAPPYNAVGNGVTDDTVAIQAAIDAANAAGAGTVLFPVGSYKVTSLTMKPGVRLLGAAQDWSGSGGSRLVGTAGSDILSFVDANGSGFEISYLKFAGGRRQISCALTTHYNTYVHIDSCTFSGPSDECAYFSGAQEEVRISRCAFSGGTYGLRFNNQDPVARILDKSSFSGLLFTSQTVNNVRVEATIANTVHWDQCTFMNSGEHAVHLDGGLRGWVFTACNTESGGDSGPFNRTTLSGSVASAATSATLASATGWAASGTGLTIQGAGSNGADHSGGAWTRSGTTITWTTATTTTISDPNVTDAIWDDFHLTNSVGTPQELSFVGCVIGSGNFRYAINNSVGAAMYLVGTLTGSLPVYDPNLRAQGFGRTIVRQPTTGTWATRSVLGLAAFTPSGAENTRNWLASPAGRPLVLFLQDSDLDGTGTYDRLEVRRHDSNRTRLFYIDATSLDVVQERADAKLTVKGALDHDGTTAGFYGVAPATRPTAYTQTYSTASKTHAAYTADAESSAYTGAADSEAKLADLNALRVAYENLRAAYESTSKVLNQVVDDLQSLGLLQ